MAEKYGMKLVEKKTFAEYFNKMIESGEGRGLIGRMQSLEVYICNVKKKKSTDNNNFFLIHGGL